MMNHCCFQYLTKGYRTMAIRKALHHFGTEAIQTITDRSAMMRAGFDAICVMLLADRTAWIVTAFTLSVLFTASPLTMITAQAREDTIHIQSPTDLQTTRDALVAYI